MRERDYLVSEGLFIGTIRVMQHTFDERMELVDNATAARESGKYTAYLRELVKGLKDKIVKVDVTRVADKQKFSNFEELQYGPECHTLLVELATWMIQGDAKAGKSAAASSESKSEQLTAN